MNHPLLEELQRLKTSRRTARSLCVKGAELRGVDLSYLRADGLDLEEADLRQASLSGARWRACSLRDARLEAADLTEAVLRLCDLDQARLEGATLVETRLENSTARGARLDGVDLTGAVLTDTDFSRASLRGANLEGVSASGADFRGADLSGARLGGAELVDADLRGADLTGAELEGADLGGADLRGVVGDHPALRQDRDERHRLPPAMEALSETMTPIVLEVLRTAGQSGAIDPEIARAMIEEAARHQPASPRHAPSAETLGAVARVVGELGDGVLAKLAGALGQPGVEAPPEVEALIRRLREELSLDESASAEDLLSRLIGGAGRR